MPDDEGQHKLARCANMFPFRLSKAHMAPYITWWHPVVLECVLRRLGGGVRVG